MPKRVYRLRLRKGEPLGLSVSPEASCFLELPPEIRIKIYHYSLIASEPLTIWSGFQHEDIIERPESIRLATCQTVTIGVSFSNDLALGLLRCNRQVSNESAGILYQKNTFRIVGAWQYLCSSNWNPLYGFLQLIGEENRRNLRNLEMKMLQPSKLWQHADGTCTSNKPLWRFCEVVPQPTRFGSSSAPFEEGFVDYLDPAIEACFRILGRSKSTLTLRLILDEHLLPGVELMSDEQHADAYTFKLDLPRLIETYRRRLTSGPDAAGSVDVLWQGECLKDRFEEQIERIGDQGWLVVDTAKGSVDWGSTGKPMVLFTLRRK